MKLQIKGIITYYDGNEGASILLALLTNPCAAGAEMKKKRGSRILYLHAKGVIGYAGDDVSS